MPVEIRNEARVHLWYGQHFGTDAPPPFRSAGWAWPPAGSRREPASGGGQGVLLLFSLVVRPNRSQAPQHVYEAKAQRWRQAWPELTVLPWESSAAGGC